MVEKLYFKDNKKNKPWIILIGVLIAIMVLYYIFNQISFETGTNPKEILNYTESKLTYHQKTYPSFEKYYEVVVPDEDEVYQEAKIPKLDIFSPYSKETEYLDYCEGYKTNINFSNYQFSDFSFNYGNYRFDYSIKLFRDPYILSDNMKNQDCFYENKGDVYDERYFKNEYDNNLIEFISNDFIKLKEEDFSDDEIVEIATIFVQSIPYGSDYSNTNRFPYETLWEKEGNCLDKSVILAQMLKNWGYRTYIISGYSEGEPHAFVGIGCEEGNTNYKGGDLCFIETTYFNPIGLDYEVTQLDFMPILEEGRNYIGEKYGFSTTKEYESKENNLLGTFNELENLSSQLDSIDSESSHIRTSMCQTDCAICIDGKFSNGFSRYCDDAVKYNRYLRDYNPLIEDYNKIVEEYNSLLKSYYRIIYEMDIIFFYNVDFIESGLDHN